MKTHKGHNVEHEKNKMQKNSNIVYKKTKQARDVGRNFEGGEPLSQGRIHELILGGGAKQVLQSKVEGKARIEGAKRPRIEGRARVEGSKRLRIEGEARTEGKAREEKTGEGSGEKIFKKLNWKPFNLVHI